MPNYNSVQFKTGVPYLVSLPGTGAPYDQYSTLGVDLSGAFTLPSGQTYNLGNNELLVFVDGVAQELGLDYTETSTTSITFLKTVRTGSTIRVRR